MAEVYKTCQECRSIEYNLSPTRKIKNTLRYLLLLTLSPCSSGCNGCNSKKKTSPWLWLTTVIRTWFHPATSLRPLASLLGLTALISDNYPFTFTSGDSILRSTLQDGGPPAQSLSFPTPDGRSSGTGSLCFGLPACTPSPNLDS